MDTEHTPGDWRIGSTPMNDGSIAILAGDSRIALVDDYADASTRLYHEPLPREQARANAELIAAAPRTKQERDMLLEALEPLVKWASHVAPRTGKPVGMALSFATAVQNAREAIEKCRDR